jgi:hypothetical protein
MTTNARRADVTCAASGCDATVRSVSHARLALIQLMSERNDLALEGIDAFGDARVAPLE